MINNILLIGGSGYLGTELRFHLKEQGRKVSYSGTKAKNEIDYFEIDFNCTETFNNIKGFQFDLVIILASKLNAIITKDLGHNDLMTNTLDYGRLLQFLNDNLLVKKIIYISSMTVYSINNVSPVDENAKIGPQHTYGLSKVIAEDITNYYCMQNNISGIILRIPGIYGGNRKSGFIYSTLMKLQSNEVIEINTNGLGYWETINVTDLSDLIINFIDNYAWPIGCDTINISYGEETDIYKTAVTLKEMINSKSVIKLLKPIDYVKFYLSNNKLKQYIEVTCNYNETLKLYVNSLTL